MEGEARVLEQRIEAVALDRHRATAASNGFEANSRKA